MYKLPYLKPPYHGKIKNYYFNPYIGNNIVSQPKVEKYRNFQNTTIPPEKDVHTLNSQCNNKNSTTESSISSTINNFGCKDKPYFNIWGINLYDDDILIICILFFLYFEGIHDDLLFICLILLLLS